MVRTNNNRGSTGAVEESSPIGIKNICSDCKQKCKPDKNSFKCCGCENWKHASCLGATAEDCEFLSTIKLDIGWICLECREGRKEIMKEQCHKVMNEHNEHEQ